MEPPPQPHDALDSYPERFLHRACRIVDIKLNDFRAIQRAGLLAASDAEGDRASYGAFTRMAASNLRLKGTSRQNRRRYFEARMPKAEVILALVPLLAGDIRGFARGFQALPGNWKSGPAERLAKLPLPRDRETRQAFGDGGKELIRGAIHEARDWITGGNAGGGMRRFLDIYNALRVGSVYAPDAALAWVTELRRSLPQEHFWLRRTAERALQLTGDLDVARDWLRSMTTLAAFDADPPAESLRTAAYIGTYYADCLSPRVWNGMAHPGGLDEPWVPDTAHAVASESWVNLQPGDWYEKNQYQRAVNLARLALYVKCHPDKSVFRRRGTRRLLLQIGTYSKGKGLPKGTDEALAILRAAARGE